MFLYFQFFLKEILRIFTLLLTKKKESLLQWNNSVAAKLTLSHLQT